MFVKHTWKGRREGKNEPHKARTASFLHRPWLRSEEHFGWINHKGNNGIKVFFYSVCPQRCSFPTSASFWSGHGPSRVMTGEQVPWYWAARLGAGISMCFFLRDTRLGLCYQQVEGFIRLLLQKCLAGIKHANPPGHSGDDALPHATEILLAQAPMTRAFPLSFSTVKRTLASGKSSHEWVRLGCAGWAGRAHVPPRQGDGQEVLLPPPPHLCPG